MMILLILTAMIGMSYAAKANWVDDFHTSCACECYEYRAYCKGLNWDDSNDFCLSLPGGVGLATIDSEETFDLVRDTIPADWKGKSCGYGFYIGLRDTSDPKVDHGGHPEYFEDTWYYEMCSYYYNWSPKEPNDNHKKDPNGQNCVQLWYRKYDGFYDDEYCYTKKGQICQIKLDCPCDSCPADD